MKRNYSLVELLRIFLLVFLIMSHWFIFYDWGKYIDTTILKNIASISVLTFALITGAFCLNGRDLIFRNIWRLLFIIICSSIISPIILTIIDKDFSEKSMIINIVKGSRDAWYLYAIIPVYLFGKYFGHWLTKVNEWVIMVFAISFFFFTRYLVDIEITYVEEIFSFKETLYLFSFALIGYSIKRIADKYNTKKVFFISLFAFVSSLTMVMIHTFYRDDIGSMGNWSANSLLLGGALLSMAFTKKIYWPKLNKIVSYLYFLYEFHWLWQYVFASFTYKFSIEHPHLVMYLHILFVASTSMMTSVVLTFIQYRFWNKTILNQATKIKNKLLRSA